MNEFLPKPLKEVKSKKQGYFILLIAGFYFDCFYTTVYILVQMKTLKSPFGINWPLGRDIDRGNEASSNFALH